MLFAPDFRPSVASRCTNIPDSVQGWYVQEIEDSQKSQSGMDRCGVFKFTVFLKEFVMRFL